MLSWSCIAREQAALNSNNETCGRRRNEQETVDQQHSRLDSILTLCFSSYRLKQVYQYLTNLEKLESNSSPSISIALPSLVLGPLAYPGH